jgi:hypothetical protein
MYVSAGATEEPLRDKIAHAHNLEGDDIQIKDRKGTICLHLDGSTINSKVLFSVEAWIYPRRRPCKRPSRFLFI